MLAAAYGRANRVGQYAFGERILLLDIFQYSAVCAAASCASHHIIHLSVEVFVYLWSGCLVVGERVTLVHELSERYGSRNLLLQFVGFSNSAQHAFLSWRVYDFSSERLHYGLLLCRELQRHYEYHLVSAVQCGERYAYACVSSRAFYYGAAFLQQSFFLSVVYHVCGGSVLHAAGRVVQLQFSEEVHACFHPEMIELDKRRVAYKLLHGIVVVHCCNVLSFRVILFK